MRTVSMHETVRRRAASLSTLVKIQFIGHAAVLAQTRGVRILSDPWWRGPCFGAQWWVYPKPALEAVAEQPIDYVYISHGHHDHFHPGTLATLKRPFRCLISSDGGLGAPLRDAGYEVIEVPPDAPADLGQGISCWIWPTHNDDTLMVLQDGGETMVNANDALHAAPKAVQQEHIRRLLRQFGKIDYLFCGYGTASHFPNCYAVPGKDRIESARRRQQWFTEQWVDIANELSPKFAFPFAADVVLLESDLLWVNEAMHNAERPPAAFKRLHPGSPVQVIDIAPGFAIEDGRITRDVRRTPLSDAVLDADMRDEIARANTYGSVDGALIDELVTLLKANLDGARAALLASPRDFRFLLRFRSLDQGIEVVRRGTTIDISKVDVPDDASYDVVMTTRAHYLRASLTTPYGNEILFVGSGVQFRYSRPELVPLNLHRYLMRLSRLQGPAQAANAPETTVQRLKRRVQGLLRPREPDLYDLATWTVFEGRTTPKERARA